MIYKIFVSVCLFTGIALSGLGLISLKRDVGWSRLFVDKHWAQVGIDNGNLLMFHARVSESIIPAKRWTLFRNVFGMLGFRTGSNGQWHWRSLTIPLWMVVVLLFIQPTMAFIRGPVIRRIRRRRNLCLHCGYDREGNESGVCPECGQTLIKE